MLKKDLKKIGNIKKAYVQTWKENWVNEAAYVASMGCEVLGIPIERFDYNDIGALDINKDTLVVGGVTAVRHAMTLLGVKPPEPIDLPEELIPFTNRKIGRGTIKHFVEQGEFPLFVKPTLPKLFTGAVISSAEELDMFKYTAIQGEDLELITSSVVKFVSEYRTFVIEGHAYDCRKYSGDHRIIPDFAFIDHVIKRYPSQPISYSIDFGVTDKGETQLIEVNDGYSLGTYGFDCYNYLRMLILRWNQILEK